MGPVGRSIVAGVLTVIALGSAPKVALADVDPASDVLLVQSVFLPYQPEVCDQLKRQVTDLTKRASGAGYPLKVAVIGRQYDLGGAPEFFGKPAAYAKFLGQELSVFGPDAGRQLNQVPLLVVMSQGFGTNNIDPKDASVLDAVSVPGGADANALARAAILAVPKLATEAGHPVAAVAAASGCTKKGRSASTSFLLFTAPIVALLIAGALLRYVLRFRSTREPRAG